MMIVAIFNLPGTADRSPSRERMMIATKSLLCPLTKTCVCLPKQGDSPLFMTPRHSHARAELVFLKHLVESKEAEEGVVPLGHGVLLLS